ncbi:MAG TPA: type I methionyl aminopeptidase [Algoriphagus sp.]|jgi:methionyl aminopeptidase|uniref:Methionine aminopeptidase n=1 Tax=Algoriphagus ornithinivorans TaxID=226506 RepID=A0A1I5FC13_9BACT|nr:MULTISPECIES: type I methionyl aminopeptidase [Algoriphagus]MAL15003.1 type I methionyl aminopeptidase [Algoriphagus sp.]MAN88880.1 type I methionyl aminopeptidase [Algoriphagus sp.]QYH39861.1 type I methionyl aminopeptidase [Algoriphagus sp. NBT04N3]SFO21277.1 methionine aminopeptidase, type I [Algoriphagus ornithinivorans]HAD52458.1 type I methionyl aminopeptidase [Algoriphagus sp.]|tara:strand:+ start:116 stop:889 length:774 start_codon:yes stop_codon:yes gene_type:complete
MIHYKTSEEVQKIKESADILAKAHGEVAKHIKVGEKTSHLDKIAEEFIRDHGAVPSFKGYNGFPASLCISVNEVVVHGFPSEYELKDGDIISVDCGVFHQGFHSDSAYTYPVGEVSTPVLNLLRATKDSLYLGIEQAIFGNRIGDIGNAIQKFVEAKGYTVVRELVGHGLGKNLHEAPEVPNYGKRGSGPLLKAGMVIAIEPMVNLGSRNIVQEADGWTIRTSDRKPSAHYEHTVAIFEDRTEVLTTHKYIEENFKF